MMSRIWMVNLVLAVCAVFMGMGAYSVWTGGEKPDVRPAASPASADTYARKTGDGRKMPVESAYNNIAEKNLFSVERKEFVPEISEDKAPEVEELKISGQKITLYGVIILNSFKKALIDNPVRKAGDRPNRWVREGEEIGNLTVASIGKESVLFQDGDKKYEILLHDQKNRESVAPAPKTGTSPNVVTTEARKPETSAAKPAEAVSDEGEYETVKTPFGNIRRKKK